MISLLDIIVNQDTVESLNNYQDFDGASKIWQCLFLLVFLSQYVKHVFFIFLVYILVNLVTVLALNEKIFLG